MLTIYEKNWTGKLHFGEELINRLKEINKSDDNNI
jgi:hypothetical protein